jgi:hypothetical protein
MIGYTTGNPLQADVEALLNTVNTGGVSGKRVVVMFKEVSDDGGGPRNAPGRVFPGLWGTVRPNDQSQQERTILNATFGGRPL